MPYELRLVPYILCRKEYITKSKYPCEKNAGTVVDIAIFHQKKELSNWFLIPFFPVHIDNLLPHPIFDQLFISISV